MGLIKDARSIAKRDPAARSAFEVFCLYPGFHALIYHKISNAFYRAHLYFLARWVSQIASRRTGVEIHPAATIGEGLFIDHGTGIVIGETAEIGKNVTIYQGVTLGGTGKEKGKRHPTVGNNVVIASGAKVLGSFKVGDHAKIGAGSVVLKEVPPYATVVGIPGRVVLLDGVKVSCTYGPDGINCTPVTDELAEELDVDLEHDELPDPEAEALEKMRADIEALTEEVNRLRKELEKNG